jgi:hypothetical protein
MAEGSELESYRVRIFLLSMLSRSVLGSMEPPIWWGTLSLWIMQLGCEVDHSLPTSAEVKNNGPIHLLPHMSSWCAKLVKHRDNFTFFLNYGSQVKAG